MRFAEPQWLWVLVLVPAVAVLVLAGAARRRARLRRFAGGPDFTARFEGEASPHRRAVRTILLLAALTSAVLALARPQWGAGVETVMRTGADVVLVIDTSRSMAATDVAPDRIGLARQAAAYLLDRLAGDRVALVTFAGSAGLACPLTVDQARSASSSTPWMSRPSRSPARRSPTGSGPRFVPSVRATARRRAAGRSSCSATARTTRGASTRPLRRSGAPACRSSRWGAVRSADRPSPSNVKATVPALMTSFFGNTGQRCLAGANLLVVGDDDNFYRSFMDEVVSMSSRIKIGYGLDESIQIPVRDKEKRDKIMGYIEIGIKEGAKLRLDGRKPKIEGGLPDTCFVGPTIFENVTANMRIGSEEIFGPVMSVMRAKTLGEAVQICIDSPFGNGHAIFTQNGRSARDFQYNVVSGNVGINIGIVAPVAFFPFSGMKDSFFGVLHTQGQEAVRFFTESKVIIQRWF